MTNHSSYLSKSPHWHPVSYRIKAPFPNWQWSARFLLWPLPTARTTFSKLTLCRPDFTPRRPLTWAAHIMLSHRFPGFVSSWEQSSSPFQPRSLSSIFKTWSHGISHGMLLLTFLIWHFIHSPCPTVLSIICLFFCVSHSL